MADITGKWVGTLYGTNQGYFYMELRQEDSAITGEIRLNDSVYGFAVFDVNGSLDETAVTMNLEAREAAAGVQLTNTSVYASIENDGSLKGTWEAEGGTRGSFVAIRQEQAESRARSSLAPPAAMTAIQYEKKSRVRSCVIDYDVLRRLHRDLALGADEAARLDASKRARRTGVVTGAGTVPHEQSWELLRALYDVIIIARGVSGEQILTLDPNIIKDQLLPNPIQSIVFDIGINYRLKAQGVEAPNRASVTIDFTRPPLFDLSNASGSPTPNSSNVTVVGGDSVWVAGIYQKLTSTLGQNSVRTGWLHASHVYDVLVFIVGLPGSLLTGSWLAYFLLPNLEPRNLAYFIAVFLFSAISLLTIFRLTFSVVRWLLPYIEFARNIEPIHRQIRVLLATVALGVLTSVAATAIIKILSMGFL